MARSSEYNNSEYRSCLNEIIFDTFSRRPPIWWKGIMSGSPHNIFLGKLTIFSRMASLLSDCCLSCYSGRSSSKIGANGVLTFREILKKMEILKGIWMDPVTNSTSILQSISASLSLWMAARLVWDIWRKWWYSVQIWWFIGDLRKYTKTMMKESFSSREHKRCEIKMTCLKQLWISDPWCFKLSSWQKLPHMHWIRSLVHGA